MPTGWIEDLVQRLGIDAPHALAVVVSAVGIYLAFLVLVRIFGQRVLSGMSTFDVASSSTRIRGSAISARVNATSWRCPAESWIPRSPTSVS